MEEFRVTLRAPKACSILVHVRATEDTVDIVAIPYRWQPHQHLLDSIKVAANARDVPYQSLIKVWLQEKLHSH